MKKEFVLLIDETGRDCLKGQVSCFNQIKETFKTKEELKNYLIDRYGKIPGGRHKIYQDKKDGSVECVGFLHSFWNRDVSNNSSKWYQTDWITFFESEIKVTYFKL